MNEFMDVKQFPKLEKARIQHFLDFLLARAKGNIKTGARYIRDFVTAHPDYKHDSIISNEISYDLMSEIVEMGQDENARERFLGKLCEIK